MSRIFKFNRIFKKIKNKIYTHRINKICKSNSINKSLSHNFIWGLGHSGTHLLYDILVCTKFFSFLGILPPRKKGLFEREPFPLKLAPQEGPDYFFCDTLPFKKKNSETVFDCFLSSKDIKETHFNFIKSRYSNIHKLSSYYIKDLHPFHKKIILDKSPNYTFMINPIKKIFPDSKHIFLLRDPRLIFLSIIKRQIIKEEFKSENNQDIDFSKFFTFKNKKKNKTEYHMDNVILQLCWMIDSIFKIYKKHNKDILIVYFEDLINNTEQTIKKVLNHFGINNNKVDFIQCYNKKIDKTKIHSQKIDIFNNLEIHKKIFRDFNKLSNELGYDLNKLSKFSKEKDTLRKMKDYKISKKFINSFF